MVLLTIGTPSKHLKKEKGYSLMNKQTKTTDIPRSVEEAINSLSVGGQTAIVTCAKAFRYGANWGFVRKDNPELTEIMTALKEEEKNVKSFRISNGYLILANENFLAYNINAVVPNAIGGKFADMARKRKAEEMAEFSKFIQSVSKGKSRHLKQMNGYYELVIGIYSVNETNAIRVRGNDYPAYRLTLMEALIEADKISKANPNLQVNVKAVTESGETVFGEVFKTASNSKGQKAIYNGLEIADSDTGIFLTLRIKAQ